MKNKMKGFFKRKAVAFLACCMVIGSVSTALAATGVYLGSGNAYFAGGDIDFDMRGYVYYNSNTSTAINIYSLAQWVDNYGYYYIDEYEFSAATGTNSKHNTAGDYLLDPIDTGENKRIETIWSTVTSNTTYAKNGTGGVAFATTDMLAGYSAGYYYGGWTTYWKSNSYESQFHQ